MTLKDYLLRSHVRSELGAQYVIENGLVSVNGHVIKDPSIPADGTDIVEVANNTDPKLRLDAPDSYWRARVIQEKIGFVGLGDSVLHAETRDGGFPMLVRDCSGEPFVISPKPVVVGKVIGTNPVTMTPGQVQVATKARVDVMVFELELDAIRSFQVLERLLPALKSRGKLVLFLSSQGRDTKSLKEMGTRFLDGMLVDVHDTFEFREGVYIYGKRRV